MFTKVITGLTLTNEIADGLFPNIKGKRFKNDVSFLATLRALMYSRVSKEESAAVVTNFTKYTVSDVREASPKDVVRAFLRDTHIMENPTGQVYIHSFDGNEESNTACFEVLDSGAIDVLLGGYELMPDMGKFLEQKKIRARFYQNTDLCNTLIFIERLDMKKWHLLQSFIPRYFPKQFAEHPLQEDELKLIKSLTNRYAPEYEERIEDFSKKFDFRTQAIRNKLNGFEITFERESLEGIRDEIRRKNDQIENLNRRFSEYYVQLRDLTTQELGLIEKINRAKEEKGEDSELLTYFLCNKNLNLVNVSGGKIEFIVTTVLSNFDPDVFESTIKNKRSFFYRHYETREDYGNKDLTDERIERLMKAIFQDEILKLRVCAAFVLDFTRGNYNAPRGYSYPPEILRDHTPNQHLQRYGCLGDNSRYINEAMVRRDYVAAISACCSSATNINLTESNTGTYFMEKICATDAGKIIQMPDGTAKTPVEAVKWLEEQENKTEGEV